MKTRKFAVPAMMLAVAVSSGAFAERIPVWPEGKMPHAQSHQIAALTDESGRPGFKADEHRTAYLEWMTPPAKEVANGGVVMLISGGSYECCCDVGLLKDWNAKLTGIGFQCVYFVYRTPRPKNLKIFQTAWEDGQRAVRLVRAEAKKRGLDTKRIGAFGMSAGSHLTLLLATSSTSNAYERVDELDDQPCNLDFAITGAIAYGADDGYGVPNTRGGDGIDVKMDKCFLFDKQTAPICMLHGGIDVYAPGSSTLAYREYRKIKVPAELHLYPDRWHGGFWQDNWWESVQGFLRQMNFDRKLGNGVDLMKRFPTDINCARHEKYDLWPEGKMPDAQAHQCKPYIEWHIPSNVTTKAIQIIYSGGSYMGNSPDGHEVAPMRRFLNAKGMTVVTMKYRTPRPKNLAKHTTAWQDLQRCIRTVRHEAKKRGLDPNRIGIMGSSAGGHLTLMGATSSMSQSYWPLGDAIDKEPCNANWAIAIYPAYGLTDGAEEPNARGGNYDDALLVPEFTFDPKTCPIIFMHGDADGWAAMNSVKAWEKLRKMGIQGELHTFCTRGHCFQFSASEGTGSWNWMNRAWEFMTHKGYNK